MTDKEISTARGYLKYLSDLLTKEEVANKGLFNVYTAIPAAPTLTTPATIVPGDFDGGGPSFFSVPGGGVKHVKTSGNFTAGFCGRSFVGTAGAPFIIVNTAGDIIGSSGSGTHGISTVTDSDYFNWYGLSGLTPYLIRSGTGGNGIQLPSRSGGSHFVIRNVVVDTPSASGFTANFGSGGANFYEDLDISFLRVFNAGQEGICYIGNTSTGFHYINTATVHDCFSYNSSREGTQFNHINLLLAYKNTIINSGQTGGPGQDGLLQAHDLGPGSLIRDSIYDGAPNMGTQFTHGLTVRNTYFRWTTLNPFFIGRTDNSYFAGSSRLTGQPCLYENCIFHCDNVGTLTNFATVEERGCDEEYRNCIFSSNITNLYNDNRAVGHTNSLIGTISTNGNSSAAMTAPTYRAGYNVYSDYTNHGICNDSTYRQRHMGFRQKG